MAVGEGQAHVRRRRRREKGNIGEDRGLHCANVVTSVGVVEGRRMVCKKRRVKEKEKW